MQHRSSCIYSTQRHSVLTGVSSIHNSTLVASVRRVYHSMQSSLGVPTARTQLVRIGILVHWILHTRWSAACSINGRLPDSTVGTATAQIRNVHDLQSGCSHNMGRPHGVNRRYVPYKTTGVVIRLIRAKLSLMPVPYRQYSTAIMALTLKGLNTQNNEKTG